MVFKYKKIILSAMLAALSVALGYLFLYVPNVEMITAAVFISGVITGPLYGLLIGVTAESLFSVFNPYGIPAPPLLIAQVIAFGLTGMTGGIFSARLKTSSRSSFLLAGILGFILTMIYDIFTTMSFIVMSMDVSLNKITAVFSTGMLFYVTHIAVNTLIFAVIVPVVIFRLIPHLPE